MKSRLFAAAILLGVFSAGCAHNHNNQAPEAETEIDEEVLAQELLDKLCDDLEHPPYYASSLRWSSVFTGMVAIGVLPEEADHQVRRSARTTVSARDIDKLLDIHEEDAEAFLDALDAAHVAQGATSEKKDQDAFAYGLPTEEAVELWYPLERMIDRPPHCGNALHWLPVYKDLMRLGFSEKEAIRYCRRAVRAGMSRFECEELIDTSKREMDRFSDHYEVALAKAKILRSNAPTTGLRAFFAGNESKAKPTPETLTVSNTVEDDLDEEAPSDADTPMDDAPMDDVPMDDAPTDDEPPADVPADDEPPADVPGE
ncbi:MAG: hypothetical protein JKY65_18260 [Planctomycetes bacterium]|nr:hypothetical protein [Planctomycetota bacterium]